VTDLLRRIWDRAFYLVSEAFTAFTQSRGPQLSAAISYRFIFSIFPIAIFLVSILGIFLQNPQTREDVVDAVVDLFSLSPDGAARLDQALESVPPTWSLVGLVSLVITLWTASGLMGAVRIGLNAVWGVDVRDDRPFVRSKLLDFTLVLGVGVLLAASALLTGIARLVDQAADDADAQLGVLGTLAQAGSVVFGTLVPIVIAFVTFTLVYRFVPATRVRLRDVWVAALVTAVAFQVLTVGFAFFVRTFGNYDVLYGSLGTVVAFLYFVYLGASVFLIGAGLAAAWPGSAADRRPPPQPDTRSFLTRLREILRGLFVRDSA
jgi:membrane protein